MDDCGAGDALRLSPCVAAVRSAFPDARVTMIASEGAAGVYSGSRAVDRVVESRMYRRLPLWRGRLNKGLELLRLSLAAGFRNDVVIVFWWGSRFLAVLAWITGRGPRIGYGSANNRFYTSALGAYDFEGDEVQQNRALLFAAGIAPAQTAMPSLVVGSEADKAAARILQRSGWNDASPLVVLHTGSDWACQQWAPRKWSEVADAIAGDSGAHVVFTGSASEREYIEGIRAGMKHVSGSLAGATSIVELAAVLRRASLLVTVDSAAYVVACSMGVPAVVLAGPSHPERLGASPRTAIVKRMDEGTAALISDCKRPRYPAGGCHDYSCPLAGLRELSVDDVLRAVGSIEAQVRDRVAI
jgi:ADP-heptose:LPS heptosyltransferase